MSLLDKIIDSAIDDTVHLATILRSCRVLSDQLEHDQLKNWVDAELNGYSESNELPPYRIAAAHAYGTFQNIAYIQRDVLIPPLVLKEQFRRYEPPWVCRRLVGLSPTRPF